MFPFPPPLLHVELNMFAGSDAFFHTSRVIQVSHMIDAPRVPLYRNLHYLACRELVQNLSEGESTCSGVAPETWRHMPSF